MATQVPTTGATAAVTGTATSAATAAGGGTVSGTPQPGVSNQFVRLSILLESALTTGTETGQITGVVIAQAQPSVGTATVAPTAAAATPAVVGNVDVPYIRYVIVDMATGTGEQLLPWQMFAFDPITSTPGGVSQNFTLRGTANARANAPRVTLPAETGVLTTGFDTQQSQYWAGQGFTIPVTGATAQDPGTQVLLRETVNGTNIVGNNSQALGQVADFLIDPVSGQFAYAVFNGGQLFGNRLFIVPIENLNFQLPTASAAGLGNVQLNINPDLLTGAPNITNLNQIPVDPSLLQQWNDFWNAQPTVAP